MAQNEWIFQKVHVRETGCQLKPNKNKAGVAQCTILNISLPLFKPPKLNLMNSAVTKGTKKYCTCNNTKTWPPREVNAIHRLLLPQSGLEHALPPHSINI